jgi:hypothetical protein
MNYKKLSLILPFSNSQRVSSSSDDDFDDDAQTTRPVQRDFVQNQTSSQQHMNHNTDENDSIQNQSEYTMQKPIAAPEEQHKHYAPNTQHHRMTVAELSLIANNYHDQQVASQAEYLELISDLHEGLLNFFANIQFANQQLCEVDKDNPAIKDHTNFMAKELLSAIREDFDLKCIRRLENYPYHEMRDIVRFLDHPYMRKEKVRIFSDGIVERCVPVFSLLRDLVNDVVTDADLRRAFGGGKYYHEDTMYSCNEQCFVSDINCFFDTAIPYFEA